MKILRIEFENIEVFNNGVLIDMTANDRVIAKGQVQKLFGSISSQNVVGIVGPNASGKTTLLKLICAAVSIVVENRGLDDLKLLDGLLKDDSIMIVDFFDDSKVFRLRSTIGVKADSFNKFHYYFKEEVVYAKLKSTVKSRNSLFMFSEDNMVATRSDFMKNELSLLKPQDSFVAAYAKSDIACVDTLYLTNRNLYFLKGKGFMPFVNLFDDSIESIVTEGDETKIKFKHLNEVVVSHSALEAENYLSSGTVKGSSILGFAYLAISTGGYLIIDEIENHLHKKLVQTIINLFNDSEINKKGATLIFSTHYSEIMDCIDRKDNIYVMVRNNGHVSNAVRYSDEVKRNDIKKSEILLSNYIDGTAPAYESIRLVKEYLCKLMN